MKTANDFAQAAIEINRMADRMTPADRPGEIYPEIRNLAVFHLRSAASGLRRAAEMLAARESRKS